MLNKIKELTKIEPLQKASKSQIFQMTGNKHVAEWVSEKLQRDDLALWFARNYKANPSIWNEQNKTDIEHHLGMF